MEIHARAVYECVLHFRLSAGYEGQRFLGSQFLHHLDLPELGVGFRWGRCLIRSHALQIHPGLLLAQRAGNLVESGYLECFGNQVSRRHSKSWIYLKEMHVVASGLIVPPLRQ